MTETIVAQHTAGPWRCERFDVDRGVQIVGGVSEAIGRAQVGGKPQHIVEANARLIAAAPELFAALKGLLTLYTVFETGRLDEAQAKFDAARAAIAKAEGRP